MNIEELKNRLDAHGLARHFETLRPHVRNSIRLHTEAKDEHRIAIGQSKIGGHPDLPREISWATESCVVESTSSRFLFFKSNKRKTITQSLSFIGQFNLQEISPFDTEHVLPSNGMLYFFYSAEQEAWGFDPEDIHKFKVLFWEGNPLDLVRTKFPKDLPQHARFKACSLTMTSDVSLPTYGHNVYDNISDDDQDVLWEQVFHNEEVHKFLGHSDNIQGEMALECELVTNGIYCGDSSGSSDPRAGSLAVTAIDWRLLLQIDSCEQSNMMWGDGGRLYVWIKSDDLLRRQFEKAWLILQCH